MKSLFIRFVQDEDGATAIEYALLAALIAVALIGSMEGLGTDLSGSLSNTANSIP